MNRTTNLSLRHAQLAVAAAAVLIVFWGLGAVPLLSFNEARRAVPVAGMYQTHNWLLPYLNGELYIDKPPLFYWAALLCAKLFAVVNEWTLRLPSALAALATLWMTYRTTAKFENTQTAVLATLVLLCCADFASFARRSEIEMLLTALCGGAIFFAHDFICKQSNKLSVYASYALTGLALLCKGPVALLFVQLPVLLFALAHRDARARAYLLCWPAWLLMLTIGVSWYAAVTLEEGKDIWQRVIKTDIHGKISGGNNSSDPFYSYLVAVIVNFLPWTLLLLARARSNWHCITQNLSRRFFLYAFVSPFILLSLMGDKHIKYLLPAYPAFAVLCASCLMSLWDKANTNWQRAGKIIACVLPLSVFSFFAFFEAQILIHRHQALPIFASLQKSYPDTQLVSYKEVDMRTVYYYGKPIPEAAAPDITTAQQQAQPVLLLLEKVKWEKAVDLSGWQPIMTIEPYIGSDQTARLYANPAFVARYKPESK